MENIPILKCENLVKQHGELIAVSDVSFEINGNANVILGSSGAGKSTLLRCINMLEIPTSGAVYYKSTRIALDNIVAMRQKIAFVFQQLHLFRNMSVVQNLLFAPTQLKYDTNNTLLTKARILLNQFNLSAKEDVNVQSLSGGQRQKVAICRALMMNPEIILFDEPTAALDIESIKDLIAIIKDLCITTTVIIVTHHVGFAKAIADNILFMDHGKMIESGTAEQFFNSPSSERVKLFLENAQYG